MSDRCPLGYLSLVHCCFTVPVFSQPFICQLRVEVQLFDALCCLVGFVCSKDSGLGSDCISS